LSRGTCSIFSAVAMCESLLILGGDVDTRIDYSEEYLQYVISPGKSTSGSRSSDNIPAMAKYGLPMETQFPYIGDEWPTVNYNQLSMLRCGKVPALYQPSCLVGHRDTRLITATDAQLADPQNSMYDPELLKARTGAYLMQKSLLFNVSKTTYLYSMNDVFALLNDGIPVLMDISFYYGAWNHRTASDFGINRNMSQWYGGIVTFPEPGSLDRKLSPTEPAGHSVLIVGYDREIVIENSVQMTDGTIKNFTYPGAFIFKNSWGTTSFGNQFSYGGRVYPGYGMITEKYASAFGSFFQMIL